MRLLILLTISFWLGIMGFFFVRDGAPENFEDVFFSAIITAFISISLAWLVVMFIP